MFHQPTLAAISHVEEGPFFFLEGNLRSTLQNLSQRLLGYNPRYLGLGETDLYYSLNSSATVSPFFRTKTDEDLFPLLQACESAIREELLQHYPTWKHGLEPVELVLRTTEEANRTSSPAREDLLHIDAQPHRPTHGKRVLRVAMNLDPERERVWVTSEKFCELLNRYMTFNRLPILSEDAWTTPTQSWFRSILGERTARTPYDVLMLKLRHFLQSNEAFQDQACRRLWNFPSFSVWGMLTDATSFAQLRGRLALEITYFLPPRSYLFSPNEDTPLLYLVKQAVHSRLRRVA